VAHLVYLSGMALDDGESCSDAASDEAVAAGISHAGPTALGAGLLSPPPGTGPPAARRAPGRPPPPRPPAPPRPGHCPPPGPRPLHTGRHQPGAGRGRTTPPTSVVPPTARALHPAVRRTPARRCITAVEWPTGHTPFLSRPDLLAGLLAGLASRPGA